MWYLLSTSEATDIFFPLCPQLLKCIFNPQEIWRSGRAEGSAQPTLPCMSLGFLILPVGSVLIWLVRGIVVVQVWIPAWRMGAFAISSNSASLSSSHLWASHVSVPCNLPYSSLPFLGFHSPSICSQCRLLPLSLGIPCFGIFPILTSILQRYSLYTFSKRLEQWLFIKRSSANFCWITLSCFCRRRQGCLVPKPLSLIFCTYISCLFIYSLILRQGHTTLLCRAGCPQTRERSSSLFPLSAGIKVV